MTFEMRRTSTRTHMNRLSNPGTKKGRLQRTCLDVLHEHEADDALPTSGRFIFYELVQRGAADKKEDFRHVTHALFSLRDLERVPWEWIVDETRVVHRWGYGATVLDHLRRLLTTTRLDLWAGEPPPLILTESRSLAGVLSSTAADYLTPIASTNGQVGGFLRTDVAPLLTGGRRVLYLGDHDLTGGQIEDQARRVLERHLGRRLVWERLALLPEHVEVYGLPVVTKVDKRYRPPRPHDAVETEALRQRVIVELVRTRLDALLPVPREQVLEHERRQRARLARLLASIEEES